MNALTMSEKFDGINATWDGQRLISRDGNRFNAPDWFVAGLPACRLVGELWVGRGRFEETCSIVTSKAGGERWRTVKYLVFDGPDQLDLGDFSEYVKQLACESQTAADLFYAEVLARGGEGIMLRDAAGNCTKRKPISDDDAKVVAHEPGTGRNAHRLGALAVVDRDGRRFKIGTGLPDSVRDNPPAIGSIVKFAFQGRTARGVPRFASFIGQRAELSFELTVCNHAARPRAKFVSSDRRKQPVLFSGLDCFPGQQDLFEEGELR